MCNIFTFKKLISPAIFHVLFWLGSVFFIGIGALIITFGILSIELYGHSAYLRIALGLMVVVLGPLLVRLFCELAIVVFKIYDLLFEIKETVSHYHNSNVT